MMALISAITLGLAGLRAVIGGPGRAVRRRAGLGNLPRLSGGKGRQPDRNVLDLRRLGYCLGLIVAVHRLLFGPFRVVLAERVGHVHLRRRGSDDPSRRRGRVVIHFAGIAGSGMVLLHPNHGATAADISTPAWRGSAIGSYRFWGDLGYGIGALGIGLVAHLTGVTDAAFWFVSCRCLPPACCCLSGVTNPSAPEPRNHRKSCMNYLLIVNVSLCDTEDSFNGLRIAQNDAQAETTDFLIADIVLCGKAGQA
ncbi:hypothetical protein [Roseovarius sp. MBR-6]|uniref:hypothetical protein n=1 Tax=Roseovarius sp. MBR-6 TaxID=3156459 RepID=UPI003396DC51